MRNSRNIRQNQAVVQNRIKQFRGRVGQRLVGKNKLKASSRRRFFNGVSPLNRDTVQDTQPSYSQYNSNNGRQNRFFQQRGLQFSQNQSSQRGYHQRQPARGQPARGQPARGQPARGQPARGQPARGQPARGQPARGQRWNVETRPSTGYVNERRRQDTSFQTGPIIRGRLKNNFGFMRSDTIAHKQQLQQNLQHLQLQQQQQQQQRVPRSWQRLKTKVPQQLQSSSARTAIYEPSSTAAVTILIPNIADSSSDVSVIFGKKSKRNRQNAGAFGRSVAIQQPPEASRPAPKKFGNRNQSVVSYEEDFDVNVETAGSSPVNSLPFHLVSRKPAEITEDLDCSVLIV